MESSRDEMMRWMARIPACLLIAAAFGHGSFADGPVVVIAGDHVGTLRLGMAESEVREKFGSGVTEVIVPREGEEPGLAVRFRDGTVAIGELDEDRRVWAIRVEDKRIPTDRGIRVGDSFRQVRSKYPNAKFAYGEAEGGYASLSDESIGEGGYFSFDLSSGIDFPPSEEALVELLVDVIIIQRIK